MYSGLDGREHRVQHRANIRLDGILMHVIDEHGQLRRTLRCPMPPAACARIRDARPASPVPAPASAPTVERIVSINGSIQIAGQKIQVGAVHARKIVDVALDDHPVTIHDGQVAVAAVPHHSTTELNRTKTQTPDHGNGAGINTGECSAMNRMRQPIPTSGAKPELAVLNKTRRHVRAGGHRGVEFRAQLRHWLTQNDRRKDELKRNPVMLWAQAMETARVGFHDRGGDRSPAAGCWCERRFKDPVASPAPV
jgi:hypothetical protein